MRKERRDFMARFSIMDWPVWRIVWWKVLANFRFLESWSTLVYNQYLRNKAVRLGPGAGGGLVY